MKRFLPLLLIAFASTGAPALANPLHVCLLECDAPRTLTGEMELNPVLYMGPSVSMTAATRDPFTRKWKLGVDLGFGYGLRYHPKAWKPKTPILSLDLYARVGIESDMARIDLIPMLTVIDLIAAGVGLRCELAGTGDRCGPVVSIGLGVSL